MIVAAGAMALAANAQTLNVVVGNVTYAIPAAEAGDMTYDAVGGCLTIMGRAFSIADITRMYVDDTEVEGNTVTVSYDGAQASVVVAGNVARYVLPSVSGAHVVIDQSDEVGDATCGEITYGLSGTSTDGSFRLNGSYKASLELRGLTLTNTVGAPIDLQDGKRMALSVKKDTENTLADAQGGSQKGCIVCKGHLELKGKGTLYVNGHAAHGIYAKEYVELKNATVDILSAVKDGIHCAQYFAMESGVLSISGVQDDGVQVTYKDDADREAEDTGTLTISGGTVNVAVTAAAAKGLKAEGDVLMKDGDVTVSTSGGGQWDSDASKTKASACIGADGSVQIDGGTLNLTSSGSGGKGISCDGEWICNGGETTITTTGGLYAYVNGTAYDNYTGSSDRLSSSQKSSPKGVRAEGNITINGGSIQASVSGNGGEGIESKSTLTVNDGTIVANAYDDALNSSSHMYIKGGTVTAVSSGNDGLDSNGNLYIQGGTIMAFGTSSPECGLDANEEEGYTVVFTGGTLLAVGGGNSVPSTSESTQPYVSGSMTVAADTEVTLKDGDTVLASFTVPSTYKSSSQGSGGGRWNASAKAGPGGGPGGWGGGGSSVLVTCPGIASGSSYTLTSGSSSSTVSAVLKGSSGGGGRPW